ncbi:unnamed protein product [Phytophthora fragariaefolia]|uniref:Unnamed protein product n=1 Tax=Phytophthora fragariaefolia TaxID=1490495 RepID=A0A9W6TM62_9STRA|nr:unnamed protein product [Phytophthora fragariaefolia]
MSETFKTVSKYPKVQKPVWRDGSSAAACHIHKSKYACERIAAMGMLMEAAANLQGRLPSGPLVDSPLDLG